MRWGLSVCGISLEKLGIVRRGDTLVKRHIQWEITPLGERDGESILQKLIDTGHV